MKTQLLEEFSVRGHKNVLSTHKTTLEFTNDSHLTPSGTCILGLTSPIACENLKDSTKKLLLLGGKFLVRITLGPYTDSFVGYGHPNLILTNPHDMVFRKSTYICNRTIMIGCSKAAFDIDRNLVRCLQNPTVTAIIRIFNIQEE
ncbi:MAG: DUF371 domain-containing protein [Candidatus Lokiarchaeota archaeon]|nr:DUF371 domain-containing protein [Candidatus Lokiarchaeota archaeon]